MWVPGSLLLVALGVSISTPPSEPVAAMVSETCWVTRPTGQPFTPPEPYPALAPDPGRFWHGTRKLWVAPKVDGTWTGRTEHGYRDKLFVWREGYSGRAEPRPKLLIKGRRLDGEAPALHNASATNAFYPLWQFGGGSLFGPGHWTMLALVDIPSPGCWELTARYADDSLIFVVWVAP